MVGHGGIVAFDEQTDMRAVAKHLLHFGAAESCGKCFPCRIGLSRAHDMFANGEPRRPGTPRTAAGGARAGQPVRARRRDAGADPQPARTLPRGAGAAVITLEIDGAGGERPAGDDDPRGRAEPASPRSASTSARRPSGPAACAWSRSRARPRRSPPARPSVRDGMKVDTQDPTARRVASAVVELVLSELPTPPAEHTELAQVARMLDVGEPRWPGPQRTLRARRAPSVPRLPARALHLLRPLRARVRRDPGDVRARRHRPRLLAPASPPGWTRASGPRRASPAAPARTPVRPTPSPRSPC